MLLKRGRDDDHANNPCIANVRNNPPGDSPLVGYVQGQRWAIVRVQLIN